MTGIFISYRQADSKAWSSLLRGELAPIFGSDAVFLDRDVLHAGKWPEQIKSALDHCCAMLVVIGPRWLSAARQGDHRRLDDDDDVHRAEIAAALATPSVTVIPVLVDGATMPTAAELPAVIRELANCQAREFSAKEVHRVADLRELCEDLVQAGAIPLQDEGSAAAAGFASGDDASTVTQITYVPRKIDEAGARSAFDAWARVQSAELGRTTPQDFGVKSLDLWWVPHWQVTSTVSVAWQGRVHKRQPAVASGGVAAAGNLSTFGPLTVDVLAPAPMRAYIAASDTLSEGVPPLLGDGSELRSVNVSEAIDTMGQEVEATVLQGTARVQAKADFRKSALGLIARQHSGSELEVTRMDAEFDDMTTRLVWCPVWRGSYLDGSEIRSFWVAGDTGEVFARRSGTLAERPELPAERAQRNPSANRMPGALVASGVGVALVVALWLFTGRADRTSKVAEPSVPAKPPVAAVEQPALAGPASTVQSASDAVPTLTAVTAAAGSPPDMQRPSLPSQPRVAIAAPASTPRASTPPLPRATAKNTPPTKVAAEAVRSQEADVAVAKQRLPRQVESPMNGGPIAPQEPIRLPDPTVAAQTPDQACAKRILGERERCLRRECRAAEFAQHGACVELRQRDDERQRADVYSGG